MEPPGRRAASRMLRRYISAVAPTMRGSVRPNKPTYDLKAPVMSSAGDVSLRPNIASISQLKPKLGANIWMRVRLSAAAYCSYFNPPRRRRLFVSRVCRQRLATANAKMPSGNVANGLCLCTTSGRENRHVATDTRPRGSNPDLVQTHYKA